MAAPPGVGVGVLASSGRHATSVDDSAAASGRGGAIPRRFLWLLDLLMLVASFILAHMLAPAIQALIAPGGVLRIAWLHWLRVPGPGEIEPFAPLGEWLWLLVVVVPSTLLFMQVLGGYRSILEQSRARVVLTCLLAPLAGLASVTLVLFALKYHAASRLFVFSFVAFSTSGLLLYRSAVHAYKRARFKAGHYARETILVGSTPALEHVAEYFERSVPRTMYRLHGYLRLSPEQAAPFGQAAGDPAGAARLPLLGEAGALGDLLIHRPVHDVIVVEGPEIAKHLPAIIEACDYFRVTLRIVPEILLAGQLRDLRLMNRSGGLQLPQIVLKPAHLDSDVLFIKRVIDVVGSATLLLLTLPLSLLIALAIKLTTPGLPVLYPWRVIGYGGRPFTGYKFTTMVADADDLKAGLMHLNEMTGPVFKIKDDPRVTRLGRFLRKYSLNELPQFWSVLKGDMSLVGPRPAGPHELKRYELWHKRKLAVQPGITCLWQVRGRNRISDFDEWVRMDLEYIDNWSLWLDLRILVRTAWTVIAGTGS
jgi:exopolysaccharide biosynthesis polyprenyl glycosylphosphotransferase